MTITYNRIVRISIVTTLLVSLYENISYQQETTRSTRKQEHDFNIQNNTKHENHYSSPYLYTDGIMPAT